MTEKLATVRESIYTFNYLCAMCEKVVRRLTDGTVSNHTTAYGANYGVGEYRRPKDGDGRICPNSGKEWIE